MHEQGKSTIGWRPVRISYLVYLKGSSISAIIGIDVFKPTLVVAFRLEQVTEHFQIKNNPAGFAKLDKYLLPIRWHWARYTRSQWTLWRISGLLLGQTGLSSQLSQSQIDSSLCPNTSALQQNRCPRCPPDCPLYTTASTTDLVTA